MEMYLTIKDGRVAQGGYITNGCRSSAIAGSFAAELAVGKTFEEILDLRGVDVLQCIGRFPNGEEQGAHFAVRTLQEALNGLLIKKTEKRRQYQGVHC